MAVSSARAAAFDILLRVEQEDAYASELLHSSRSEKLSPADHGLTTELVMGVLRWRSWLDSLISRHSSQPLARLDPEILTALRLAVYQFVFLSRVPKRAAVHESVELVTRARKRSAAPFANAVLRKMSAEELCAPDLNQASDLATLAEASAHPLWLVERWAKEFGADAVRQICAYNQHPPPVSIHLSDPSTVEELTSDGITLAPGALISSAYRVLSGAITRSGAFCEGRVFIQDEASQLVALLVGKASNILDCCAAPGGKTRLLAERNPQAKILALELHAHRARLLRQRITAPNVEVVNADVLEFAAPERFERVLADVPCSGTGTLSRHPEIKWRLKPEDLADLQMRQFAILQSAMRHLARGGRLVYSTCSLEREENEDVLEKAVNADTSFRMVDGGLELERLRSEGELAWTGPVALTRGPYLRTIPGVHPCDGFFAAILERTA
jgi:16S rRNA (cytosine967-C5)-methyltransferase